MKTTLFLALLVRHSHLDPIVLNYFRSLGEMGIDEVMIRYPDDPATFELLATELIPMVEAIPVAGH